MPLQISANQMAELTAKVYDSFISRTASELAAKHPEWAAGVSHQEVSKRVKTAAAVAQAFNVHDEDNIVRFSETVIMHDLAIPLHPSLRPSLETAADESTRVDAFVRAVELNTHRLIVISLDSDLTPWTSSAMQV